MSILDIVDWTWYGWMMNTRKPKKRYFTKTGLVICLIALLSGCGEPQRAIIRGIYCDDVLLGETLVPEGSWGFGPYTLEGGYMQFNDMHNLGRKTIVNISGCKRVKIQEEVSGLWTRQRARRSR